MLAVRRQRDRTYEVNDEIPMANLERMTVRSNSLNRYTVTSVSRFNDSTIQRFTVAKPFVILVLLVAAGASTLLAQKRPITEKDLWDFVWVGDPQVSPDGSRVAFVRVAVNEKKEGYNTSIWSVPIAGGEGSRPSETWPASRQLNALPPSASNPITWTS